MTVNQEIIQENVLKENYSKNYFNYLKVNSPIVFQHFLERICDLSCLSILDLTYEDSYLIRKRMGVYDGGEIPTFDDIGKTLQKTVTGERARQKYNRAIRLMQHPARKKILEDSQAKMSSMQLNETYQNKDVSIIAVDENLYKEIKSKYIYTLKDLLSYSFNDLKILFGNDSANLIVSKIHGLGLKVIEELTVEEKRSIVENSPLKKIHNSSLNWITGLQELQDAKHEQNMGMKTRKFVEKIEYYVEEDLDPNIVNYAKSIGFDINYDELFYMPIDQLLQFPIVKLKCYPETINCLLSVNIKTINHLLSLSSRDLKQIPGITEDMIDEIVYLIHRIGLSFQNEKERLSDYTVSIFNQLDSHNEDYHLFMDKYAELKAEEKRLLEQLTEVRRSQNDLMEQLSKDDYQEVR